MRLQRASSVTLIIMGTSLFAVPMIAHMVRSAQVALVRDPAMFRELASIACPESWACYGLGALMILLGAAGGRAGSAS